VEGRDGKKGNMEGAWWLALLESSVSRYVGSVKSNILAGNLLISFGVVA
jgi:hypothetical protein